MKRKTLVLVALLVLMVSMVAFANGGSDAAADAEPLALGTSIRTLTNPYQANYKVGGDMFAEEVGLTQDVLTCEGSSEKQLNDIKALIAKTGGNVVFMVDPNEAPNVIPIGRALDDADVYWVSWWNKPEDVNVWDYKNWVSHIAFDGISAGEYTAQALIDSFGGNGKIIALQGMLANSIAQDRFVGLNNILAANPGVELVAYESAEWDRTMAYEKTLSMLVANPDIDGVWAANDNMALGALEALRSEGLAGKVLVTGIDGVSEIFEAIQNGEAAATVYNDSKYQAGIALAIAKAAKDGDLDVAAMPKSRRQFFADALNVNQSNVDEVVNVYVNGTPDYDFKDLFASWSRAME